MSREKVIAVFDLWAQEGKADELEEHHGDVVAQVMQVMEIGPGEKVLDLGCGNGWATRALAKSNAGVQAIGVDASPQMIARADELHSYTIRARYDFCPFEELDFKDAEFDRLFSMEAIYYASDLERALSEALRVLKPGAKVDVLLDYYEENEPSARWSELLGIPMQFLGEQGWKAAFEGAGFVDVQTSRVIDSRGPGDEAAFEPDVWAPDWATHVADHEAGSLWIRARKAD